MRAAQVKPSGHRFSILAPCDLEEQMIVAPTSHRYVAGSSATVAGDNSSSVKIARSGVVVKKKK